MKPIPSDGRERADSGIVQVGTVEETAGDSRDPPPGGPHRLLGVSAISTTDPGVDGAEPPPVAGAFVSGLVGYLALARELCDLMARAGFDVPSADGAAADAAPRTAGLHVRLRADGVLVGWHPGPDLLTSTLRASLANPDGHPVDFAGIRKGLATALSCILDQAGYAFEPVGGDLLVSGRRRPRAG